MTACHLLLWWAFAFDLHSAGQVGICAQHCWQGAKRRQLCPHQTCCHGGPCVQLHPSMTGTAAADTQSDFQKACTTSLHDANQKRNVCIIYPVQCCNIAQAPHVRELQWQRCRSSWSNQRKPSKPAHHSRACWDGAEHCSDASLCPCVAECVHSF